VLLAALVVTWIVTLWFGYAGLAHRGSASPSLGPGMGAAIAIMIAGVCGIVSIVLAVLLGVLDDRWWPGIACLATLAAVAIAHLVTARINSARSRR
jgi:hypothetical protein